MSTPRLVRDIFSGSSSASPSWLTAVGSTLYFTANDGINGYQLWRSNGSSASTQRVASNRLFRSPPTNLTALGDSLFFAADDGTSGLELWTSNGTAAGTVLVADLKSGSASSRPSFLTPVDNLVYFTTEVNGYRELWRSDGTTVGTRSVWKSRLLGRDPQNPSLTRIGKTLLISANDGYREIWKSNGNTFDTSSVTRFNGTPLRLTPIGNTVFFTLDDDVIGDELWKSDGTANGSVLVADINKRTFASSSPRNLTSLGKTLFFTADDGSTGRELWTSNGSAETTVRVADIRSGAPSSNPSDLTPVGNTLYFVASDAAFGTELWKTDGTSAGTMRVADINPGRFDSKPQNLTAIGKMLFFTADDGRSGRELWSTDGTAAGTVRVADLRSGSIGSDPANLTVVGNSLYFTADNGNSGRELWTLDDIVPTQLGISATDAETFEGAAGSTRLNFTITRSGDLSAAGSVRWRVIPARPTRTTGAVDGADFSGGVLPRGLVRFGAGERSAQVTIDVRGDRLQERDERFVVSLSGATAAVLIQERAIGTIRNDDRIGTADADTLIGSTRSEFLDGRAGADILIGAGGSDVFGFRFRDSRIANPDRITDFDFGTDRIDLFAANDGERPAPLALTRSADNGTASSLRQLAASVFADADGALPGNQPLLPHAATLVVASHVNVRGTYLLINDGDAALNPTSDLLINITGFRGNLPDFGPIPVDLVFG